MIYIYIYNWLHFAVPNAAPNVTEIYNTSSSSIMLNWTEIPYEYRNGIIIGHRLKFLESDAVGSNVSFQETFVPRSKGGFHIYEITNLQRHTMYNILISAVTSKGDGPFRNVSAKTGPYGK